MASRKNSQQQIASVDNTDAQSASALSRAERRRLSREGVAQLEAPKAGWPRIRATMQTSTFRFAAAFFAAGLLIVFFSQVLPHDYGFLELGWLFTLSVYDLVLAMLGLSVAVAMAGTARRAAMIVVVFAAVMLPMLLVFDPIFTVIRESPLGQVLFLVAPAAVFCSGAVLWLPGKWRDHAAILASAIVSLSLALFIGLDDLGVGIADFASGAFFCALWLIIAPALLLRPFRGAWLTIPARIIGSWLIVISMIVTASLYVPDFQIAPQVPAMGDNAEQILPGVGVQSEGGGTMIQVDPSAGEP